MDVKYTIQDATLDIGCRVVRRNNRTAYITMPWDSLGRRYHRYILPDGAILLVPE